jgi:hypothetical protein
MRRRTAISLFIVVGIVGLWLGWKAGWYMAVDACLDAGGAWEYHGAYCYGTRAAD